MSRILKYQDSMNKFIKTKSYISTLNETDKNTIFEIIKNNDSLLSIIVLTVINCQTKKNKINGVHGYYLGCGLEIMLYILKILDRKKYYNDQYGNQKIDKFLYTGLSIGNVCLNQNVETLQTILNKEKFIKIFTNCNKILNQSYINIFDNNKYNTTPLKKTDIVNLSKIKKENGAKEKIKKIRVFDKQEYWKTIENKYCNFCKMGLYQAWHLGGNINSTEDQQELSQIQILDSLAYSLGVLIKIFNDIDYVDYDIDNFCSEPEVCSNIFINLGIQETFEIFVTHKQKFTEACMLLDIYTNTIKEITDYLDKLMEDFLNTTEKDLKSHETL